MIRVNDLRTPVVLLATTLIGYVVGGLLAAFTLDLASHVARVLTYCILALLVSWLVLRYGNGSDDVISAIDGIADFLFAMVCGTINRLNSVLTTCNQCLFNNQNRTVLGLV